jgi:ribosomal protein S18 acetylase RimI-like enzyme
VRGITSKYRKEVVTKLSSELEPKNKEFIDSFQGGRSVPGTAFKNLPEAPRNVVERSISNPCWAPEDEEYRDIVNMLNLLEDLANAVYQDICDLNTVDKMYGRLLVELYQQNAYLVHRLQRRFGLRSYDQLERLVDDLNEISAAAYHLTTLSIRLTLFLKGPRAWGLIGQKFNTREQLIAELQARGIYSGRSSISLQARRQIVTIRPVDLTSTRELNQVYSLFAEILLNNRGKWPVILKPESIVSQTTEDRLEMIKRWFDQNHLHDTDIAFGAWLNVGRGHPVLVGYVGVQKLSPDNEIQHAHWDNDLRAATQVLGLDKSSQIAALRERAAPLNKGGASQWLLDPEKLVVAKNMGIHPKYRSKRIGRLLFRNVLRHARIQLQRNTLLDVIADDDMTAEARRLYDSEGGEYIGACNDRQSLTGHRMFFYLF